MKHTNDNTENSQLAAAVHNLEAPQAKEVYYEHLRGSFWVLGDDGKWLLYKQDNLRKRLRLKLGLDGAQHDGAMSEVDTEIERIMNEQYVDAAFALAGYNAGLYIILGQRILVVESPKLLLPVEGDHSRFLARLQRFFGDAHQVELFCGWLHFGLGDLYEFLTRQTGRNVGMGLVIGGASGLGKSLLLNLIVECFGGRRAHPAQHAKGATSFNNDLTRAEVHVLDDEGMGDSYSARKEMGDFVKRTVAVDEQRCHPKGKDAFPTKFFCRLVFCLNDEVENLQVLPPLERGVQDKLVMLKAVGSLLDEGEQGRSRHENRTMLLTELAWFVHWLMNTFELNDALFDTRFGVMSWHHPDLVEGVDSLAPEFRLLDMIYQREELFDKDRQWTGTARELEVLLKQEMTTTCREAYDLLRGPNSIGRYLGKLASKRPEAVRQLKKDPKRKIRLWQVIGPEAAPATYSQPTT